ncbi:MAG: hypothetical protein QXL34_06075 [Thermosphaera sp.]
MPFSPGSDTATSSRSREASPRTTTGSTLSLGGTAASTYLSWLRTRGADLEVHGYYINGLKCHFKTFIIEGDSVSEVNLPVIVPAGESREIVVSLRGGSDCNLSFTSGQIIELLLETNTPIQYRTMITLP